MISKSSSDVELLRAIQNGRDKSAFEIIVKRYEQHVFRLCFRITNGREESEDIAQEIFIKLWEQADGWQPSARFSTWLYRVTTNRCLNKLRFLKIKSILTFSPAFGMEMYSDSTKKSPESMVIAAEKSASFYAAFQKLPGRQKAALHLRYWEDLSVREVADVLEITVKSAESLIYRGKKALGMML